MAKSMPSRRRCSISECATLLPSPMKASLRPLQLAEVFAQRLHVGQRLAGMVEVAQRVDDRHRRPLRQLFDGALRKTRATMPSTQRSRLRATSLSGSRTPIGPVDEDRVAAQLLDGQLEGQPGAQRGLFKQQGDGLAIERAGVVVAAIA